MKKISLTIALLTLAIFLSAPAWSATMWDGTIYDDHVAVSGSNQGEVLIYPVYVGSDGGNKTRIQVINTSMEMSAVAKVVIRSARYSQECRDFFIFLSPTDMWEGTIMWQDGETVLWTDDDSFLTSPDPTFASKDNPFTLRMVEPGCGDLCNIGYVEVFLSRVFPGLDSIPTIKSRIYEEYVGPGSLENPDPRSGYNPAERRHNTNILAGSLEIVNDVTNDSAALHAVALQNYGNVRDLNPAIETIFGEGALNTMMEVEAALSKDNIAMPYYDRDDLMTYHLFNFPTKLTRVDDCEVVAVEGEYTGFQLGSPSGHYVEYNVRAMDMKEQTRPEEDEDIFSPWDPVVDRYYMPEELHAIRPAPRQFTEGWYRYSFTEGRTDGLTLDGDYLEYTGAPVIPFIMNFGVDGLSMHYTSYEDGFFKDEWGIWQPTSGAGVYGEHAVTGEKMGLPGYQYTTSTPGTLP